MALAILFGGIVGLLVAGGILAVGTIRQARHDENDINHAFAEARGEKHDPVIGPAPWSPFDMEALCEEELEAGMKLELLLEQEAGRHHIPARQLLD